MIGSNYSGKQANNTAYIKNFAYGVPANLWKVTDYKNEEGITEYAITPSSDKFKNLYIPGDLFIDGDIVNPSDIRLKKNVEPINDVIGEKLMNLRPCLFEFKDDPSNNTHYGFIAHELEKEYPELIHFKPHNDVAEPIKAINYLEILPLLVHKMQKMQKELDELKSQIATNK